MQIRQKLSPAVLAAATGLLQPFVPELSPQSLVDALKQFGAPAAAPEKAPIDRPLTRAETANLLGVHITTLNRYMKSGLLRRVEIGPRIVRIDPASVRALLNHDGAEVMQ